MDRATRNDLVKTVQQQEEKIKKYETKLRDVVLAYKGLSKEKEALESLVQVLNASATPKQATAPSGGREVKEEANDGSFTDPLNATQQQDEALGEEGAEAAANQTDVLKMKEQIATISNSLATVMQEKSKMEANYLADKKKLRLEHEEKIKKSEDDLETSQNTIRHLQEQMVELKGKVRSQQHEREKEQNDHAMMLRELQKLLADERMQKERVELQLSDVHQKLVERERSPDVSEQYEKRIRDLSNELQAVRNRLKASEETAVKPSPLLLQLQKEMAEMKAQHRIAVQQEQKRVNEAESREQSLSQQSEQRVSGLEEKLSELSDIVGNYERLRYQDQVAIQRLKERVTQLDLENTALARVAHTGGGDDAHDNKDDANQDVQALVDKITKLKGMLKLANERSEKPVDIEAILGSERILDVECDNIHKRCSEEYSALKEEFERYKLRAQSVLKNKSSKDSAPCKETESLKKQAGELREHIRTLRVEQESQEADHKAIIEELRHSITLQKERHAHELATAQLEYNQRSSELETQLHKHRDRTIALLAEKDQEIDRIRNLYHQQVDVGDYSAATYASSSREMSPGSVASEEDAAVSQLLSKSNLQLSSSAEGGSLLHFAQEKARRDVEIAGLRKQKHTLESTLRELQLSNSSKEENYTDQIDLLKEEVRKHERNKNRESANLEYLKNVVYQYMTCTDSLGKHQMLNAISTILQFSPKEKETVRNYLKSWWGYSYSGYRTSKK